MMKQREFLEWYESQRRALQSGAEIEPPWIAFSESEPYWGGWRQGYSQVWFFNIWIPIWSKRTAEDRRAYLDKWNVAGLFSARQKPASQWMTLSGIRIRRDATVKITPLLIRCTITPLIAS